MDIYEKYLNEHSVNQETADNFGLKSKQDKTYGAQLVIPIKDSDGNLLFNKYRNLERSDENKIPKYIFDIGAKETTFNAQIIKDQKTLILMEGEIDVIRASQDNFPAISGTNGASSIPDKWKELLADKSVYVCYDNDVAGKQGVNKLAKIFPKAMVISLPDGFKDVSEFLSAHSRQDFISLIKAAKTITEWQVDNPPEEHSILTMKDIYNQEFPPEAWIIDKFLPQEGFVMISGDAGVGKSFVALEIIRAITTNTPFLDHFEIKIPEIPILVIDKENGMRRIQKRAKGMNIPPSENIYYLKYPEKFTLDNLEFIQNLQTFIKIKQIRVAILDSFIDVLMGNENAAPDTSVVFNALRSIATNICWVPLHHEAKPIPRFQRAAGDRVRGSSNIKAQVDYLFSLSRTKSLKVLEIEQGKARDYETLPKFAVEFQTSDDQEMSGFKYLGEVKDENSKVDTAIEFVEDYLFTHPDKTRVEILDAAEGEGIGKTAVERAIKTLKEKNIINFKKGLNGADMRKSFYYLIDPSEVEEESDIMEQLQTNI